MGDPLAARKGILIAVSLLGDLAKGVVSEATRALGMTRLLQVILFFLLFQIL